MKAGKQIPENSAQKASKNSEENDIKNLKRSLTNKNRQICTLNRIINNLRNQITSISNSLNDKQQAIKSLKQNVSSLKKIIQEKQSKQIQMIRKQEQLIDKLFKANQQLQKRQEETQRQLNRHKSENKLRQNYLSTMKGKYKELQRENHLLGAQIQLRSEAQHKIRQSRQSHLSGRQMSLHSFNFKPVERRKTSENPFQGFLKPQYQETFLQMSRFTQKSHENRIQDNTWCKIDELMRENFQPANGTSTNRHKSKIIPQQRHFKNRSEIDAQSAIQMIRQENQKIKISLR